MSDSRKAPDVLCPFYVKDEKQILTCEGFPDSVTHRQFYQSRADLEKQMDIFCCTWRHKLCEMYRLIMESKYQDESDISDTPTRAHTDARE